LAYEARRQMFVAFQLPAAMSRQFSDDGFRNAAEEKNRRRHVPKLVNPQLLDAGAGARSLEGLSHPTLYTSGLRKDRPVAVLRVEMDVLFFRGSSKYCPTFFEVILTSSKACASAHKRNWRTA